MSYILTKADGSVFRSRPIVLNNQPSPDTDAWQETLREDLAGESGALVLRFGNDEGALQIEGALSEGMLEGIFQSFVMFGDRRIRILEQSYRNDLKNGRCIAYHPDGSVMYEGSWDEGLKQGPWIFHAPKIRPAVTLSFEDDHLHGETTVYSSTGAIVAKGEYQRGNPIHGTFIADPWEFFRAAVTRTDSFNSVLSQYKDGQQLDSKPIIVETGF